MSFAITSEPKSRRESLHGQGPKLWKIIESFHGLLHGFTSSASAVNVK
jgi:hypothetical protein